MLILLPPSEGKTAPTSGPALDLGKLSYPGLTTTRQQLIDELIAVSERPDALSVLGVGPRVASDVEHQRDLWNVPCAPASEIYTGVLFHALDLAHAHPTELQRANETIRIFSGLFGLTTPSDIIPPYRLAMGTALPAAGNTKTLWKKALATADLGEPQLVVDARSGAYQVWNPPAGSEHVIINAARIKDGKRSTVSHNAKHYRGLLAGALIRSATMPQTANQLAEFARTLIGDGVVTDVELEQKGKKWQLTLVENLDRG